MEIQTNPKRSLKFATLKISALIVVATFLLTACNTLNYDHSFNPNTDLTNAKTFSLLPIPHPEWDQGAILILGSEGLSLEVAKSILEEKGYQFVKTGDVDFLLGIRAEVRQTKNPSKNGIAELAFCWEPIPPPHITDQGYSKQIRDERTMQGSLDMNSKDNAEIYFIIEAFDTKTASLAWQGWAKSSTQNNFKGDDTKANLVYKILKQFPN